MPPKQSASSSGPNRWPGSTRGAWVSAAQLPEVMQEVSAICLELALGDLLPLPAPQREQALKSLMAIDPDLAIRLQLSLCLAIS